MPYTVNWYLDKRIILANLWDDVTVDEYNEMAQMVEDMLTIGNDPYVHCIINMANIGNSPTRLVELQSALKPMLSHPQLGWSLPIMSDETQRYLVVMLSKIYQVRWREMKSIEEALQFLAQMDQTLPPLAVDDMD